MKAISRILNYIDYKGVSVSQFEKDTNLSNGYIGKMEKRNADIGEGVFIKILENCPDLSEKWLLIGEGNMLKKDNLPIATKSNDINEGIPLIPIEAMAGFGSGEVQILDYECERYIIPLFKDAQFLIQVKGSSMYPKYSSGDVVACKKLSIKNIFFQWNKVYVLDTEQGALIKRIKQGKDENHILLVSENQNYQPFQLHLSQINSISIVIGVIRLE